MALIIGRDFSDIINGDVQAYLSRHDRIVVVSSNVSPLVVQQRNLMTGESAATVATYSNYYVGDFQGDFEVHYGTLNSASLLSVNSNAIELTPSVSCGSNLRVASNVSASTASFSAVVTSNVSASNLFIVGSNANGTELLKVSAVANNTTTITNVLVAKTDYNVTLPTTNARLGIGVTAPEYSLHVAGGASIGGPLLAPSVRTSNIYSGVSTDYPRLTLDPVTKDIVVYGNLKLAAESTFLQSVNNFVNMQAQFAEITHMLLYNTSNMDYPDMDVLHVIPTYCNEMTEFAEAMCNTEPILNVTVDVPFIDTTPLTYTAFQIDGYGRIGVGTQPQAMVHLDAHTLNAPQHSSNAMFDPATFEHSHLPILLVQGSNTMNPDVPHAFVIDEHVRLGLGTTQPAHLLHLDAKPLEASYDPETSLDPPPGMLGIMQSSPASTFPYVELKDDLGVIVTTFDSQGHLFVGSNAETVTVDTLALATTPPELAFKTAIDGDALVTGTAMLSGLVGRVTDIAPRVIDFHGSFASNVSNIDVCSGSFSNLTAPNAQFTTLNLPGLSNTATRLDVNLVPVFKGSYAVFSDKAADVLASPSQETIYAETQGKVKIAGPDSLASGMTMNTLGVYEGHTPNLMIRNTSASASSFGTISFFSQAEPNTALNRGYIKYGNRAFSIVPSGSYNSTPALKTTTTEINALGNAMIVSTANSRIVTYFNSPVPEIESRLRITNGVQIQGDLWVEAAATGSNTVTINGALNVNGKSTLSNVDVTGQMNGYAIMQWSDSNLKTDITPLESEDALGKIMGLQGCRFRMRHAGDGAHEVGLIAQEVAKVVPEVVRETNGYMSVAYGNLSGLFVEAIKALNEKVERLSRELAEERSKNKSGDRALVE